MHLHESWLMLTGNVRINFGAIWHFVLFSLSIIQLEMLKINTKVNTDYIVSSC